MLHVLDPQELKPKFNSSVVLIDMETDESIEVTPEYAQTEYRDKMQRHLEALESKARASGIDYHLLVTDRPLDTALREYLAIRRGRM